MIEILQRRLDMNLKLLHSFQEDHRLTIILELETKSTACPYCGHFSTRPHSSYIRSVHDLPIHDQEITLIIHLHKWFCDQKSCLQAEKVCHRLHMPASHDTLLNLIKNTEIQSDHENSPFCSH
ncbi:MAG TPA: transposase family protein [Bacillales bacterium]|nr:transposase family protein [Bacillales bacterium]